MQTDKFTWLSTFESFDEIPSDFLFFFFDTFAHKILLYNNRGEPGEVEVYERVRKFRVFK